MHNMKPTVKKKIKESGNPDPIQATVVRISKKYPKNMRYRQSSAYTVL